MNLGDLLKAVAEATIDEIPINKNSFGFNVSDFLQDFVTKLDFNLESGRVKCVTDDDLNYTHVRVDGKELGDSFQSLEILYEVADGLAFTNAKNQLVVALLSGIIQPISLIEEKASQEMLSYLQRRDLIINKVLSNDEKRVLNIVAPPLQ